jgi:hypothetical protein
MATLANQTSPNVPPFVSYRTPLGTPLEVGNCLLFLLRFTHFRTRTPETLTWTARLDINLRSACLSEPASKLFFKNEDLEGMYLFQRINPRARVGSQFASMCRTTIVSIAPDINVIIATISVARLR